ncbi:MAG TPA: hypothetical protein PLB95_06730 [Syntrophales bacterium]|nr:hypothetical protein [Syntrophales bacterium]HOH72189.1 hypothetical protein [Syntrophales bacterium]HPX81572.1 hypothetical protein [Syntrophales bacterium]HQB14115.1 hypothetical protein [Syntrophales bacterium]HQK79648.1 hypothetical protein [Syntrophales bacterium]
MNGDSRAKTREAEHKRRVAQRRARRRLTIIWMVVITVFSLLIIGLAHFTPVIIDKFTIVDDYLPRDIERQYWELQDTRRQQPVNPTTTTPQAK